MRHILILLMAATLFSCDQQNYNWGDSMTKSGYEYITHTKGSGDKAEKGDYVKFSFQVVGSDSSVIQGGQSPENYPAIQVPKEGQTQSTPNPIIDIFEAAQVGDSVSVFMPIDSMKQPNPAFANMEYIKYVITVKDITSEEDYMKEEEAKRAEAAARMEAMKAKEAEIADIAQETLKAYKANKLAVKKTDSGLKYFIHEEGSGPVAKQGETANVNYYGLLVSDGSSFDNSYKRGNVFSFNAGTGAVIKGWDEALLMLPSGTKASLFIPADLAYGATDRPGIPGGSELMFYIDVE